MRSAAGVRLCRRRRRHSSTSSSLGLPRGSGCGLRRGGGAGPGDASRMLHAAPSPPSTRPEARRGRPSHPYRTLSPPPPAGPSVPPPPRPRNGSSGFSSPGFVQPSPLRRSTARGAGGAVDGMAALPLGKRFFPDRSS